MKNYSIINNNNDSYMYSKNHNNNITKIIGETRHKNNLSHSKKILPKLNKRVSLIKHGYRLKRSNSKRRQSLNKASNNYGTLPVLRRVNLIRNYSKKNKKKYSTLSKDVDYMKNKYAIEKKKGVIKKSKKTTKKKQN